MKDIFVNLDANMLQHLQNTAKNHVIILKFTAEWCGPCKRIKNLVESHYNTLPDNVLVFELDIDDQLNIPLYSFLKSRRQLRGIPGLLAYYGNTDRPFWFVPDNCVNSANVNSINHFFYNASQIANSIANSNNSANQSETTTNTTNTINTTNTTNTTNNT